MFLDISNDYYMHIIDLEYEGLSLKHFVLVCNVFIGDSQFKCQRPSRHPPHTVSHIALSSSLKYIAFGDLFRHQFALKFLDDCYQSSCVPFKGLDECPEVVALGVPPAGPLG